MITHNNIISDSNYVQSYLNLTGLQESIRMCKFSLLYVFCPGRQLIKYSPVCVYPCVLSMFLFSFSSLLQDGTHTHINVLGWVCVQVVLHCMSFNTVYNTHRHTNAKNFQLLMRLKFKVTFCLQGVKIITSMHAVDSAWSSVVSMLQRVSWGNNQLGLLLTMFSHFTSLDMVPSICCPDLKSNQVPVSQI